MFDGILRSKAIGLVHAT